MGQLRKMAKALSKRVKTGDADAAAALLAHSVKLGHGRLAIRRFIVARALGASVEKDHEIYCVALIVNLAQDTIDAMAKEEHRKLQGYLKMESADVELRPSCCCGI